MFSLKEDFVIVPIKKAAKGGFHLQTFLRINYYKTVKF